MQKQVAPFAGAWIEITALSAVCRTRTVAPFAGAWIEIDIYKKYESVTGSLPSRERGLKSMVKVMLQSMLLVAPFAGAWIEIQVGKSTN